MSCRRERIKRTSSRNPRPRGRKWPTGFPIQPTRSGRKMNTKSRLARRKRRK